ncbi:magnesium chelatase [Haliscomenobacter hydrossis]|uniref:Mg-chelatase subunit ChlI-like protein n=1 Tax=Haliscomenobacter hydrossis (strain ATCC 27775 / DSM 1100 / LMG 10767 / O) TaxID=760192 RepID=F4KQA1_HALH1|nr:magnesium chelatase [Haliscomenobacter hydrossis]AEE48927.1 Mg-chelatase subunit ChlI-like protein [Haliscomenobacter hydrossis DSM 1100]
MNSITTLGALKASGYQPKSVKAELRANLIEKLKKRETIFEGVLGFEDTVLPDIERAVLSRHNILLLGLRGQAKTRIARLLVKLLDEYIPVVGGSELNDDPLNPISRYAKDLIAEMGDATPVEWLHRDERYVEKLATPDVSVADLIGDVDPIKAATLKMAYSDERVIHFGLVPRAHRSIFVINELPDLQARIQVSLFNILQEGDIQIRGFKLRLPLDIQFLFTANPEDYTNRGSIITPLKDRIESQILTHYPKTIDIARSITKQEAKLTAEQRAKVEVPDLLEVLLEQVAFEARDSEFVDSKSGVSARLTISGYENLVSTAERRLLINRENKTIARLTDFWGVVPAITGKVELVYEGEQEGPYLVAINLMGKAFKKLFLDHFPDPDKLRKGRDRDPYGVIRAWFSGGHAVNLLNDMSDKEFRAALEGVAGLRKFVEATLPQLSGDEVYTYMELVLHGLAEFQVVSKDMVESKLTFRDTLADMLSSEDLFDEEDN